MWKKETSTSYPTHLFTIRKRQNFFKNGLGMRLGKTYAKTRTTFKAYCKD